MSAPPPDKASDTRDRLIEAARNLFWQHGYASTSINQILEGAKANSGSLYYFFPTKEDLLLAVLEKYTVLLRPIVVDPVFARVTDPIERIFGILDGYRRGLISTECRGGCPIGNLALELADRHPAARQLIGRNFQAWRDTIAGCLREAAPRLPPGSDPDALAAFVLSVMEGAIMQVRVHDGIEPFESCVATLRDYFERLLAQGSEWQHPPKAAVSEGKGRGRKTQPKTRKDKKR